MLYLLEPKILSVLQTRGRRESYKVESFQIYCKAVQKVVCGQWQMLLHCPVRTCLNSLHFRRFDKYLEV